jgi:ribonuclease R
MIKQIFKRIIDDKSNFTKDEIHFLQPYVNKNILIKNNNKFALNKKYKVGFLSISNNYVKLNVFGINQRIIHITDIKSCNDGDLVIVQLIFNPRGTLKAKILEVLQSKQTHTLCYINKNSLYDIKSQVKINANIKIKDYKQDDVVLIQNYTIIEYLGNLQENSMDEKISLYLYNQQYRIKENYSTNINTIDYKNRIDLTSLEFATIDPLSAKDHDDAIYFDLDNSILYVAIADVSAYIKEDSNLDKEAKKRAFSIYLPNKVLPMIPRILSDDLCSLRPNVNRLSYVCKMYINTKTLEVVKSEFIEAIICSHFKYSYEQIDKKIQDNSLDKNLDALYKLIIRFRDNRLKKGYDFRTSEFRLQLDDNLNLIAVDEEKGSPSHKLVEECMLQANIQSAITLDGKGIYRTHEEPDRKKIDELLKNLSLLGMDIKLKKDIHSTIVAIQKKAKAVNLEKEVDILIIQSQQQAVYQSDQAGHFGLGFTNYSHFTSPIRRYSDLVLHRILKTKKIPKDIDEICQNISTKEREITKLVWDLEDRIYARYALNNIDKIYEAIVVNIGEFAQGKLIHKIAGLTFDIENYTDETLFSNIKIKFTQSDLISKRIIAISTV